MLDDESLLLVDIPTFDRRFVSDVVAYGSVVLTEAPVDAGFVLTDEPIDQVDEELLLLLVDTPTFDERVVSAFVA